VSNTLIASELIEYNTKSYAKYILSHHFANPIDGLKKVKRRILMSQPTDKAFSAISMIANTLRYHPYGDLSTYQSAARLSDVFRSELPLLNINGTTASYGGDKAAAARYVDFQISSFCRDIMFDDIDFNTIPTEHTEDLTSKEIKYFIPKLPTALLYENESVGFGYNSRTLPLKFENVCTLVSDFIKSKDKDSWTGKHLVKLMVPFLPIHVNLVNTNELIEAYRRGEYTHPIETEGIYQITPNKLLIRTMHYGATVDNVRSAIEGIVRDKNHWAYKEFDATLMCLSEDVNYADFEITIKRGTNIFEFVSRIASTVRLRGKCHPKPNFVYQDGLVNLDTPSIMKLWYKERYRSKLGTLKYKQQKCYATKMKLETYLTICEHTDEVTSKLRTAQDYKEFQSWASSRFELSQRQCEILVSASIQVLMKTKREELETQLKNNSKEIETINTAFGTIDNDLVKEINTLKKRYSKESKFRSYEPNYIGCLIVGELGIIQIRDLAELEILTSAFKASFRFILYPRLVKDIEFQRCSGKYTKASVPYTVHSPGIKLEVADHLMFTRKNRGVLSKASFINSNKSIIKYVTNKAKLILHDGTVCDIKNTFDIDPMRGSVKLLFMFDTVDDITDYWVISVNDSIQKHIRVQHFKLGESVILSAGGTTDILDVIPVTSAGCFVQLPSSYKENVLELTDIPRYIKDKRLVDISVRHFNKY